MSSQSNKFEVVELGKFEKTRNPGSWLRGTQPFSIAFVYSDHGNFVVKGMNKAVENYVLNHYPNSIYYISHWHDGKSRGHWNSARAIYINLREVGERYKYVIMIFKNGKLAQELHVRRVPHRWLDIFNQADVRTKAN